MRSSGALGRVAPVDARHPATFRVYPVRVRIHLDTDLGSDTDDLCALAMLLGWSEVEVVGVTTVSDPGGIRAGMTRYALNLVGRNDIPVVAGAEGSLGGYMVPLDFPDYWPGQIEPRPSSPGAALDLLAASVEAGATVVAIGPFTNLALFEAAHPAALAGVPVVVMGGWVTPPGPGLPPWTPDQDFNVQQDAVAAKVVFERCRPIVTQVAVTLETWLRERDLAALEEAGPLGALIAEQARRRADDYDMRALPKEHEALPEDLLNFQYDPLACSVACGWDGVSIEELPLRPTLDGERLRLLVEEGGTPTQVVTGVESDRFSAVWLDAVTRASRPPGAP